MLSVVSAPLLDDWPLLSKGSRAASNTLLQTNSFAQPATGFLAERVAKMRPPIMRDSQRGWMVL